MKSLLWIFLTTFLPQLALSAISSDPIAETFLELLRKAGSDLPDKEARKIFETFTSSNNDKVNVRTGHLDHQDSFGLHPEVRVQNGLVIGETVSNSHAFYSIPYAKPPVGALRFMPPEPAEDFAQLNASLPNYRMCWQIKDCHEDDPNCKDPMSEDCLVLNINVPGNVDLSDASTPPTERLPVLVWIHGGFFFRGRSTTTKYDGRWLSEAINAVVVTVNYRVGPLGFLSFEDELGFVEGNQGIKDQQLALKWVQGNIALFGGDEDRVTIFANSAGSQAINFHLMSSTSDPLFHRAITESSPAGFHYESPQESIKSVTNRVLEAIGCQNNVTCLRIADAETLTNSRNLVILKVFLDGNLYGAIEPFRPVIDGVEFKDQPLVMFENGLWQTHKEVIFGTNQEEMAYVSAFFEDIGLPLPKVLFEKVNTLLFGKTDGPTINSLYEERLDINLADNFASEITDFIFVCPNRALARFASKTSTNLNKGVYLYNNAYALSVENCEKITSMDPVCGNAYHSSEQIFVFKSAQGYETNFTAEDTLVSDMFSTYWGGFAATGNPSSGLQTSLGDFTSWPVYTEDSQPTWTNIHLEYPQSTLQDNYRSKYCDVWDKIGYDIQISLN